MLTQAVALQAIIAASVLAAPSVSPVYWFQLQLLTLGQKEIQAGAPHVLVSDPSSQQVTSSDAFSSGAGNKNNSNIYDGTGDGGNDQYSEAKSDLVHCCS